MSFLYVLLLGMLSLFFFSYLLSDRDILSPSTMMTIMFSISSLFAILNIRNWNIDYNVNAGLITITGVFVFIVSEMIMKNFFIRSRKQIIDHKLSYETKFVGYSVRHWKLYLLIIINTLIIIWYFLQIRSLVGGGNISAMFQEYRRIGVNQLEGRDVDSVGGMITHLLKIVEGSGYVASYLLISNVIYQYKKHRTNFLLLILIFLSILPSTFGAGSVGVVLDLMIHDIDIILSLVPSPIARIAATGRCVQTDHEDIADAQITFENGVMAHILVSRVSEKKQRQMEITH